MAPYIPKTRCVSLQRFTSTRLDEILFTGLYPPVHDRQLNPTRWYTQYINTYIERDVRQLADIKDLSQFQRFLRLCAARCGSLLNLSDLARDTGVSHTTIRSWLSILEASYIIFTLPPHFSNFGKRLVKTPKLYFYDPGLACRLLSIAPPEQLNIHPIRGALFETFIISELKKRFFNNGERADIYFWRDKQGLEVDIVHESGHRLNGIEIKSGSTLNAGFIDPLIKWKALCGKLAGNTWLVYGGDDSFTYRDIPVKRWKDHTWLKNTSD